MTTRLRRVEDGRTADRVRALAIEHPDWSAGQVHRAATADDPDAVSLRTVQRFLRAFSDRDQSERWSIEDAEPEDIPLVLGVVRQIGGMRYPTRAVASWIVRLLRAYPDLTERPIGIYFLAVAASRGDAAKVQDWLTYTAWRDGGRDYALAFRAGRTNNFMCPGGFDEISDETWQIVIGAQK